MQVEVTGLTFALSSMMGARQVLGCYAGFAALGTWARWVLQPLRAQSQAQAEAEAALRSGAVRVCAHAEEIESLGGKAMEGGDLRCVTAAAYTSAPATLASLLLGVDHASGGCANGEVALTDSACTPCFHGWNCCDDIYL